MENKIERLNKRIELLRGEGSRKDKIMVELKNKNKELIEKLATQKTKHEKSLQEEKVELDKLKKKNEYLKAQSNAVDR